ncbi:MAG: hypothetical protein GX387_11630 [Clostridium sp.]|nr:hypothetical protein [Clostridium sp.]
MYLISSIPGYKLGYVRAGGEGLRYKILIIIMAFFILCGCSSSIIEVSPKKEVSCYSEKLFEWAEDSEISISCDFGNIEFFNWDKKVIKLEIKKKVIGILQSDNLNDNLDERLDDFKIELIEDNDKLNLDIKYTGKDESMVNKMVDLKIYLPKCIDVLNLYLDKGWVKFHDDLKGILNADINMADIEINKFTGTVNIKGDMGNVSILDGRISKNSSIIKNIGSISIKSQFEEGGEYIINTGTGNIDLWVSKDSKVSFESVGAIEENDFREYNYSTKVKVKSSIGKISIKEY